MFKIFRKLSSVNTRHISSVELKSFDLGNSVPLITNTYLPKIDHQVSNQINRLLKMALFYAYKLYLNLVDRTVPNFIRENLSLHYNKP